jgi:hypothetical protein
VPNEPNCNRADILPYHPENNNDPLGMGREQKAKLRPQPSRLVRQLFAKASPLGEDGLGRGKSALVTLQDDSIAPANASRGAHR